MRIVIADDDMLVSGALRTILEKDQDIEVQGIASNGKEAIKLYRKYEPDVLLMDIRMSPMSGLEASEEILKEKPEAKILLLTTFSDDEYIVKALKCGVKGYLLKTGLCKYSAGNPGSVHGADGVRNSDHIQTAGTFRAKECF